MSKRTWVTLGVLLLAAALVIAFIARAKKAAKITYHTEALTRGDIDAMVVTTGTLNPVNLIDVGSQISGQIIKIDADFNTPIKKGQLLAEIDRAPYLAAVEQKDAALKIAQANLEQAMVSLDIATKEYDRHIDLFAKKLISQEDKEAAEESLAAAKETRKATEASLQGARDELASARVDLSNTYIRSPIDGIVVSRLVSIGQTVAAGMQAPILFRVADDISRLRVESDVDEADVGRVKSPEEVRFEVDAFPKEIFHGRVVEVRLGGDTTQNVVSYKAIIEVDNPESRLKPGMTALVSIHTGAAVNVLRIPNEALRFDPGREVEAARAGAAKIPRRKTDRVWVLAPDGKPVPIPVKTGLSDSVLTALVEGNLREGQVVITGVTRGK